MTSSNARGDGACRSRTFAATFVLLVAGAALATVLLAPPLALGVSRLGFHFPFSRIFDRAAMAALVWGLLWQRRRLKLAARLERGFASPRANLTRALRGLGLGLLGVAMLWALAATQNLIVRADLRAMLTHAPSALATGVAVGVIEEGFFRALLLDGLQEGLGAPSALIASAAVYAAAHLVRSRSRFELNRLDMGAGLRNLAYGLGTLLRAQALAGFVGLSLLGLVLGLAFQRTGTVYFSLGLHAALVFGLKSWRYLVVAPGDSAGWVVGYGWPPLVSGVTAWGLLLAILLAIGPLSGGTPRRHQSS
jgi:membrane protease YdiL (CAAX protease family)